MTRNKRIARYIRTATQDEDAFRVLFGPQFSLHGWDISQLSPKNVEKAYTRYKSLILKHHPDRYQDTEGHLEALQKTKELNEAWAYLADRLPRVAPPPREETEPSSPYRVSPQSFGECMEARDDLDYCDEMFAR
jgi:hypothetical protein